MMKTGMCGPSSAATSTSGSTTAFRSRAFGGVLHRKPTITSRIAISTLLRSRKRGSLAGPDRILSGRASSCSATRVRVPIRLFREQNSAALPEWTRNGSFLVFRRLTAGRCLVLANDEEEAERLSKLRGFEDITYQSLAARLVGRWPSGAPVNRVPNGDDMDLGKSPQANNNFRFDSDTPILPLADHSKDEFPAAKADPAGTTCPWAAHIRKVNLRDSGSDMGGRDATYSRRVLRTGIPFGKSLANPFGNAQDDPEKGNRGLLFLSIQSSIEAQFEFLVARWMGDPTRPKTPGGHDIVIGQNADPGKERERLCAIFGKGLQQAQIATKVEWVIPTGGGYFFLPSIRALRQVLAI